MGELRFAGVDWASEEHAVCVVDEHGRIVEGRRYRHDETGIRALCSRLVRLDVKRVGIERPDGLLIERLLDAGLAVIAVHPNQVKASRPRDRVAGGKSDGFDSFVLAELARTDAHRFRVLVPDGDETKALRAMTRARDSLVRTRVGLANQLRDQLATFWPGASKVFSSVDSQISLAFLKRYPTPVDAHGLGEQRLAAFLKRHGFPGRKPAGELLERLRGAAEGRTEPLEWRPGGRSCSRSSPRWTRSWRRSARCRSRSATRWTRTPTGRRSARCSSTRTRGCAPRACSPRSATAAIGIPPIARSLPMAVSARSRSSPAKPNAPSSAGRAITACAKRSTRSQTPAGTTTHGPRTSITARVPAELVTRTPAGSSAAPGAR